MDRDIPIDPVLEKGYNVRLLYDDYVGFVEAWMQRSAEFRTGVDVTVDLAYGDGERDKLDVFRCGKANAPLFVFIHGGYWQRGDKAVYSFVADSFLKSDADVALIGYQLCPDTDMDTMAHKIRQALVWLWRNASDVGVSADRINLSGHSAGGHMTAMLLATKWDEIADGVPRDLIKTGNPISGLYQLNPIRHTTIGDALGLDDASSMRNSPHFMTPSTDAPILVTLGGGETPQFHWQTDEFIERWRQFDAPIEHFVEPDVDHFQLVNRLANSESEIFKRTRAWLR